MGGMFMKRFLSRFLAFFAVAVLFAAFNPQNAGRLLTFFGTLNMFT